MRETQQNSLPGELQNNSSVSLWTFCSEKPKSKKAKIKMSLFSPLSLFQSKRKRPNFMAEDADSSFSPVGGADVSQTRKFHSLKKCTPPTTFHGRVSDYSFLKRNDGVVINNGVCGLVRYCKMSHTEVEKLLSCL